MSRSKEGHAYCLAVEVLPQAGQTRMLSQSQDEVMSSFLSWKPAGISTCQCCHCLRDTCKEAPSRKLTCLFCEESQLPCHLVAPLDLHSPSEVVKELSNIKYFRALSVEPHAAANGMQNESAMETCNWSQQQRLRTRQGFLSSPGWHKYAEMRSCLQTGP